MNRPICKELLVWGCLAAIAFCLTGCTPMSEYVRNGFKVGPDYCKPAAPVAQHWIDESDKRIRSDGEGLNQWWIVFNDPVLDNLIQCAYRQNLTLREAGFRVLQARALRGVAVGELFPQKQTLDGGYTREGLSEKVANRVGTPDRWFNQWSLGFGMGWELDFWGRFRRAVEAADAELDASVENYDDVLVTLLADVGTNYVEIRTLERRLELARGLVQLFQKTLEIPEAQFKAGDKDRIPYDMAKANLGQAQALVPQLETSQRQTVNRLCVLLGMPPQDLQQELDRKQVPKPSSDAQEEFNMWPIPRPPREVVVGIPADLLRRRPDVRRAERLAAAQSERIGIAQSDFYPQMSITGSLGWSSKELKTLFDEQAFRGSIGPEFRWNILNYGRIVNNVRYQDARFRELVTQYQATVLKAAGEAENALVSFVKSQERAKAMCVTAACWRDGTKLLAAQYRPGQIDFLPLSYFEQNLLEQQDRATQAQGDIPLALIEVYRALGGGWQIRLETDGEPVEVRPPESVPPSTGTWGVPNLVPTPTMPQGAR
jgi:NodT family efflux transporter outer membrane factor (OMF) lipoprotein